MEFKEANKTVGVAKTLNNEKEQIFFTHIGEKAIKAKPMTRGEHSISKGFEKVLNGKPEDPGYQVIYEDGYESWSPKDVFEKAYKENGKLTFGAAIEFGLKKGKRVQRSGWNGKGMFIFMQVPSKVPIDIVPKMTSLPQSVKDEFDRRSKNIPVDAEVPVFTHIRYQNQIAMVYPDNNIYGWVASPSDILEEDWIILD